MGESTSKQAEASRQREEAMHFELDLSKFCKARSQDVEEKSDESNIVYVEKLIRLLSLSLRSIKRLSLVVSIGDGTSI